MTAIQLLQSLILGFVEGFTEFLPVSSTGHLLLLQHFFGLSGEANKTFAILVQLGAILAIVSAYFGRLLRVAQDLPREPAARYFVIGVLIAFLPAAIVGALLHGFIKGVLFNPLIVCISLIAGGFVLMIIDQVDLKPRYNDATSFPLRMYVGIGCVQCLAMIPGVSRSGATIVGAMLLGADKRSAAEFSFFLAMPTMAGAFAYDLLKSYKLLAFNDVANIAVGFLAAFAAGLFVVKAFLNYISRHGFTPFAWWRILVGSAGLAGLLVVG
ncbi:undecaprenyl-diphosphate phosphatase [Enterovirga aerilata]|uniref:Undecaprenyl-diphosphatase n=1 Tax=Enterovirga aerilata TaxID=2730920 RepID=A0A849I151_9HYPH|nr:undecaprenyl-diphosphate phosphatase [Enterovirga sp. DB1703]NNM71068.1 undecaprenyl-diphosphate phosphatase [Enterovirga sp. DB1703]